MQSGADLFWLLDNVKTWKFIKHSVIYYTEYWRTLHQLLPVHLWFPLGFEKAMDKIKRHVIMNQQITVIVKSPGKQ